MGRKGHEKIQTHRQDKKIEKGDAREKQQGAGKGVAVNDLPLPGIKPGGYELPKLINDPRAGEQQSGLKGQGDRAEEPFLGLQGGELCGQAMRLGHQPVGPGDDVDDFIIKIEAKTDGNQCPVYREKYAFAQLIEVLAEGHAGLGFFGFLGGLFGEFGHRRGILTGIDCSGIRFAKWK